MDALDGGARDGRRPAILALTPGGLQTGRRLRAAVLPGAEILARHGDGGNDAAPLQDVGATVRSLFAAGRPIIGICAAAILVRTLAPVLGDKAAEPPVLAVAEDGSAVVPLLGGHRGANVLAERIAGSLGGVAAVTTAGDRRLGVALDAPPPGWRLADPAPYKRVAARLIAGEAVRLEGPLDWLESADLNHDQAAMLSIVATDHRMPPDPDRLVYHPASLALGIGCERGCPAEEVEALVRETLRSADLAEASVAGIFSLDLKEDEPALIALAGRLGVPLRVFDAARLEAETPRLATPSEAVFREVGCHGVAEAAALAAAGPRGDLAVPKRKTRGATCAIARAPEPIDPRAVGRARGSLAIVGTGPGTPLWRTPEAEAAVARATDLVGYGLYLDLLGAAAEGKTRHALPLGAEEDRARLALDLAAEGRQVALVSSGDPGIYAMATLVYELLDKAGREDWRRVAVSTLPGISALQAAAARVGAPLGHDFCTISLSDLLTPWPVIEKRLAAAGQGDFVVALYNPVSRRRTAQLGRAREILLAHRPPETPVVLGRDLGRPGEQVAVTTLGALSADRVDMLTVILIGASTTRRVEGRHGRTMVYTPRGYADKPTSRLKSNSGETVS